MANELKTPETIKTFLLAGKAVLTVENTATGNRFTYKVRKAKANPKFPGETWFVSVLTGSNNEADYSSLGMLKNGGFRSYNGTGVAPAAKSYVAFGWLWSRVAEGKTLPESVVVRHEGNCCRCGRLLTVPESIDSGIGPECRGKMGLAPAVVKNKTVVADTRPLPPVPAPVEDDEDDRGERALAIATPEELLASMELARRESIGLGSAYDRLFPAY